ncbi:MAG: MBL fold metallo-hydrolase [Deltaproteobacteria bacterium]
MFSTTFLGHQGWMVHTPKAAILVDPLLCEDFGQAHELGYRVYPPRRWTPEAAPVLDAVILTHEHDDHFDLPSLAKLERTIPIYLSARSSIAARGVLETMGFSVRSLVPGVSMTFGDLEVTPFTGDHKSIDCGDEWDTLPFLVRSTEGHGSFFSMVDITITQAHVEWAAAKAMRPGIISWTNNAMDWSHMADYLAERVDGTQQCFVTWGVGHKLITTIWGTPAAMVMCAGGFSFAGERAWLDRRVFCVDADQVVANMTKLYPKEKFFAGVPGQTFVMKANKLVAVETHTPWLATEPRETWPSRAKAPAAIPDYTPATGRRELAAGELDRLATQLDELAGSLVGGGTFRSLHSLLATECGDRLPTFAIVVRDGEQRHAFEYRATECRFVASTRPDAAYLAGIEVWASDLVAVLDGAIGPIALTFGRARLWNALPERFSFEIFPELHRLSHPLRRPAAYAKTYDRLWTATRATMPVFKHRQ